MRQYKRSARFNRLLQEEISDILRSRLKDPRIGFASVVRVEATEDLRSAKIYVSVLDEDSAEQTILGLESAAGLIRRELHHRMSTRRVPALRFFLDQTISYSVHISKVLADLKQEEDWEEDLS
jgi:ribosome-binding factor A